METAMEFGFVILAAAAFAAISGFRIAQQYERALPVRQGGIDFIPVQTKFRQMEWIVILVRQQRFLSALVVA